MNGKLGVLLCVQLKFGGASQVASSVLTIVIVTEALLALKRSVR